MPNSTSDKPSCSQGPQVMADERQNQQIVETDMFLAPFISAEVDGSLTKRVRQVIADNQAKASALKTQ